MLKYLNLLCKILFLSSSKNLENIERAQKNLNEVKMIFELADVRRYFKSAKPF